MISPSLPTHGLLAPPRPARGNLEGRNTLVLSLFPGADLLGLGIGQGYPELCIVRGPDIQYGSLHDIKTFHPPAGCFGGVIGGPPCQHWSRLVHIVRANSYEVAEDLIPEFVRCVSEAAPAWFLMEEVPEAPVPEVAGYAVHSFLLNNRWLGEEQSRKRRFTFGLRGEQAVDLRAYIEWAPLEPAAWNYAVTTRGRAVPVAMQQGGKRKRSRATGGPLPGNGVVVDLAEMCRLQGLPADFFAHSPLTVTGKRRLIGNGVPLATGRALGLAIRRALAEIDGAVMG